MQLKCQNVGKLKEADIQLKKITVIAGLNDTGKSTIGRLLYCTFNSFYHIEKKALRTLKSRIREELLLAVENPFYDEDEIHIDETVNALLAQKDTIVNSTGTKELRELFSKYLDAEKINIDAINLENIKNLLFFSQENIYGFIFAQEISAEFSNKIQNVFHKDEISKIELTIKDKTITAKIKNNTVDLRNSFELDSEVIYIDDPFVLDNIRQPIARRLLNNRNSKLMSKLTSVINDEMNAAIQNYLTDKKTKPIMKKLAEVCRGEIDSKSTFRYMLKDSNDNLPMQNLSTGLKTFIIIQMLLANGQIRDKGVLVLDEPEIHLHPEWQLLFAEIIVMLQQQYNLHILINSHSPYFIEAIELYAKKAGIYDDCYFYVSDYDGDRTKLKDTNGDLESIFKLLSDPFDKLDELRAEIEEKADA